MTDFEKWALSKTWWIDLYEGKDGFVYCKEKGFTIEADYDYLMKLADERGVRRPSVLAGG